MRFFILFIVLVCNLSIILFGVKNLAHSDFLSNQVAMLQNDLKKKDDLIHKEKIRADEVEKKYKDLEVVKEKVKTELEEKKKEAKDLAMQLAKEKQKRKKLEKKLKNAEKKINTLNLEVKKYKEASNKIDERVNRMADRLEKQDTDKQALLSRLKKAQKDRDEAQAELKKYKSGDKSKYSLAQITISEQKQYAGVVLNVNERFNFCIVSIGKEDEIVPGIKLVIHRGSKLIAKIEIERVFDKMSSAKIISITKNEKIQVEDKVRKF